MDNYLQITDPDMISALLQRMMRPSRSSNEERSNERSNERSRRTTNGKPAFNIKEDEKTINIYMDLAGVAKEDIDIQFNNNKILIKTERTNPLSDPDYNEIYYGLLERTITLPICITQKETVTVSFENGMLYISLDKTREEKNRFNLRLDN